MTPIALLRSGLNITLLLIALVVSPLLLLSHFNAPLAEMLGDAADRLLPNSTLLAQERKARVKAQSQLEERRILAASQRASNRAVARSAGRAAHATGNRVLLRGAGALAVGWVPVVGVSADVFSLAEDYSDLCELFFVMDSLYDRLELESESLYEENYCDVPQQGVERIKNAAADMNFPWLNP